MHKLYNKKGIIIYYLFYFTIIVKILVISFSDDVKFVIILYIKIFLFHFIFIDSTSLVFFLITYKAPNHTIYYTAYNHTFIHDTAIRNL
jgi:hypothetical protein